MIFSLWGMVPLKNPYTFKYANNMPIKYIMRAFLSKIRRCWFICWATIAYNKLKKISC
jgi:hypothetical protein